MSLFNRFLERIYKPVQPLPSGIYHYQSPPEQPRHYRYHLRIENNGQGVLILNASAVLHLNQTAAEYAYHLLHNTGIEETARQVAARYRIKPQQARQDYTDFKARIEELIENPDLDPTLFLDFNRQEPYTDLAAPYRLDCALTYRLPGKNG
ncbi:MAG: PqqD family protein, partial [Anaerolineaceae bacterium]|nr:PqqD family protein [Anaerolineaceae bacterium]